jgi:hypothetical protein
LFSFKTNFFFAKTRDGFEGVQRRGPVKGAGKFRVHRRPLTGSTAGITPVFERRGFEWRKNGKRKDFGGEHQMKEEIGLISPSSIVSRQDWRSVYELLLFNVLFVRDTAQVSQFSPADIPSVTILACHKKARVDNVRLCVPVYRSSRAAAPLYS